jgi:hypothetical protein
MKYTYLKSFCAISLLVATVVNTGCDKLEDFGDTDTRSDASVTPITSNLLTNAQVPIANLFSSTAGGIRGALYTQQWAETQYTDVSIYGNPQLDFGGTYSSSLKDLQSIIDLNTNPSTKSTFNVVGTVAAPLGSNANQIGVATILKSYYMWTITDRWGDIPYSEALKGAANLTPKYDKQEDIYRGLLADLKAAVNGFDDGPSVAGDIYFDGDVEAWKKVANSMRMLIALRMSKVYPNPGSGPEAFAATEFAAASNDAAGAIVSNDENWTMVYPGGTTLQTNAFYSALNGRKDYALSRTVSDILDNMGDERRSVFGSPEQGFPYGLPRDQAVVFGSSYAKPFNPSVITATSPIVILPASYVLLAKAEAVELGWITGDAKDLYEAGVTASFEQWNLSSASSYLAGNAEFANGAGGGADIGFVADFPSILGADANTTNSLERIRLQRYLASFGDGIQSWAEWRRTGIPRLKPTAFGVNTPREIPRRLTYGTTEYAANPGNVAAAAARLTGGDVMNARVWWDKP